jgi:hypothetical protein
VGAVSAEGSILLQSINTVSTCRFLESASRTSTLLGWLPRGKRESVTTFRGRRLQMGSQLFHDTLCATGTESSCDAAFRLMTSYDRAHYWLM